ncbi:hypothetical protein NLG97_g3443 [Lecanicillium saksenae]|uniref:Uncharacterized protein n=1 Tax=Lecanicillium saksenae TaxID=468837 RepID=A0ACC1R1B8_9HYPO|nr:hypothetical protein NLG97_g3443 [Lecanicillium saksenae]
MHIATYPIDQCVASRNGLRFHGCGYTYIARQTALHLRKEKDRLNIIALHLGSGACACAIKNGCSWDTSMGLTPVSGLTGATRSGSIDPRMPRCQPTPLPPFSACLTPRNLNSLGFHYTNSAGKLASSSTSDLHISRAEEILDSESGWQALAGTTDFGVIATLNEASHRLAFDLFVDRMCAYVGSYHVSLRGDVDALVFASGIGEKSSQLRRAVVENL